MAPRNSRALRKNIYRGKPLQVEPPAELSATLDRHRGEPDALITILAEIQEQYGYLSKTHLHHVSRELGFPLARVYGVATFYNLFLFEPPGRYKVRVCRGTACHVNGSGEILRELVDDLGVAVDDTTSDGLFTLQTVACMGACSLAPVVDVGDQTHGRMSVRDTVDLLNDLKSRSDHSSCDDGNGASV